MDTQDLQKLKNKYDIIGDDSSLNLALEMAVAVGSTDLTVLVTGESGVGKDVIPRIIHQNSLRRNGKYLAVNCAAIPEGTVDSELFGHEKGSFTGAIEARKGYFEEANGGTLFLDEIGELPLATQAKLLRVLQSGEYIRVGSSKVQKTDVRLIAATNVNLLDSVAKGKFRMDLYYRLSAICIHLPALRERKEDTYLLFRKFTSDFSEKYGMTKIYLTRDAIELLKNYRWPGNIRELQSVANAVSLFESDKITPTSSRKEVDARTLGKYLRNEEGSLLPAVVPAKDGGLSDDERSFIYERLSQLEMAVRRINELIKQGDHAATHTPSISEHSDLPSSPHDVSWSKAGDVDIQDDGFDTIGAPSRDFAPEVHVLDSVDDQSHTKEAETSLSIKGNSEDLIRRALEKHGGNRKKAAEELEISERTLYRRMPPEYKKASSSK